MSERAGTFLRDVYDVPDAKIDLIAHGIPDMPFVDPVDRFVMDRSDDDSTFTASSRPMPHLGWHVIIERKYRTVVEPITAMRSGLVRWGIIGLAILVPVEILALAGMFRREKFVESHRHA